MPERTCLGCRKVREKSRLIRFAVVEIMLTPDIEGRLGGRGVYLCPQRSCLEEAYRKKGSFRRAFKREVSLPDMEEFSIELDGLLIDASETNGYGK